MAGYLRFCNDTEDKAFTTLLVGNDHIIQPYSASVIQANKSERIISELKVHTCESILQVLSAGRLCPHVDYIVFCLDSRSSNVTQKVEEEIGHLSKLFLLSRICLVLFTYGGMSRLDINSLMNFRVKYQLHQLNCRINNSESKVQVSLRLLRLASHSCGLITGFPAVEQLSAAATGEKDKCADDADLSTSFLSSNQDSSSSI